MAAAVTACKNAREGKPYDADALEAVFSRSGFTDGYLMGKPDGDMFGARTKEDVTGAASVLPSLAALYHKETPLVAVDMDFSLAADSARLTVTDGRHTVTTDGPMPEVARTRPLDEERARQNLSKTGGTQYYVNSFKADIAPNLTLPASSLNAMRREAIEALDNMRGQAPEIPRQEFAFAAPAHRGHLSPSPLWGRFAAPEQVTKPEALERIILPMEKLTPALLSKYGDKLTAELPALLFPGDETALEKRLAALREAGLKEVWADNIYAIELARRLNLAIRGGFGLNVTNTEALDFYEKQGLKSLTASFELPMEQLKRLAGGMPWGAVVYGYLPLMRFRACPVRAGVGCEACRGDGSLTDRRGVTFPVVCSEKRFSTLLNSVPLHIAGRDDPGDFRLLYFTRETAQQCGQIITDFLENRPADGPRTGGLYYRALL